MQPEGPLSSRRVFVVTHTLPWTWDLKTAANGYSASSSASSSAPTRLHEVNAPPEHTSHHHTGSMTGLPTLSASQSSQDLLQSSLPAPEIIVQGEATRHHLADLLARSVGKGDEKLCLVGMPPQQVHHTTKHQIGTHSTLYRHIGDDLSDDVKARVTDAYNQGRCDDGGAVVTVFVDRRTHELFYDGYCKNRLHSVLHYGLWRNVLDLRWEQDVWDAYVRVNRAFAHAVMGRWRPGDGEEKEVLTAMLHSERILFQSYTYIRHFSSACLRSLGIEPVGLSMPFQGRRVGLGVALCGIDARSVRERCRKLADKVPQLRAMYDDCTLLVSVDSVDDSRGVAKKLAGYLEFWRRHAGAWRGKLKLVQIVLPDRLAVPGRSAVDPKTERQVSELVGALNGQFGTLGNAAVIVHSADISDDDYWALLQAGDVYVNTSERGSIPLAVLDFLACRPARPIIVSEFVEVSNNLPCQPLSPAGDGTGVWRVNPWDPAAIADALECALLGGRVAAGADAYVERFDARQWAQRLLRPAPPASPAMDAGPTEHSPAALLPFDAVKRAYDESERRLFFLDYDGTLVSIERTPEAAAPTPPVLDMLARLQRDPRNDVYVVSGRTRQTLAAWLGGTGVGLAAEHGAFVRLPGHTDWSPTTQADRSHSSAARSGKDDWKQAVANVFAYYRERTPGSFVEEKETSLTWHFRLSEPEWSDWQARECMHHMDSCVLPIYPITLLMGKKNLEVRLSTANKGTFVQGVLATQEAHAAPRFVMCCGDDTTDEDMFYALQHGERRHARQLFTVRVDGEQVGGSAGPSAPAARTAARFRLASPDALVTFLSSLLPPN